MQAAAVLSGASMAAAVPDGASSDRWRLRGLPAGPHHAVGLRRTGRGIEHAVADGRRREGEGPVEAEGMRSLAVSAIRGRNAEVGNELPGFASIKLRYCERASGFASTMRIHIQKGRSVLSAAITVALCIALWFSLDVVKLIIGQQIALALSAIITAGILIALAASVIRRRQRQ